MELCFKIHSIRFLYLYIINLWICDFFSGEANDSVVLCSESAVFELKEAETSNSLLLVKDLLQGDQCKELKNLSNGDCENPTEDMEQGY